MQPYSKYLLRYVRFAIGKKIHHLREERGWSSRHLSLMSSVSERLIDRYEIGNHDITVQHLLRIACAFGVDIQEFI